MRKEFLTYGLWMLTLVASLFVVSACQKDDSTYDNTEVMMTFTTRALVSPGDTTSTAIDQERMRKLRVIMVRENGDIVDNHVEENITQTSVTFTFSTPVRTGGEDFTFFAIANEDGLTPTNANELDWLKTAAGNNFTEENLNAFKSQTVGTNGSFVLNPNQAIPQTKYWTVEVPQIDKHKLKNQQLDYLTGKISVKFKNQTNQPQSLSDIKLTGIMPNGKGYLFAQASNDYVGQDIGGDINLEAVTNLAAGDSITQNYYTYPIDAANISNPVLHATWKDTNHQEFLSKLTSLLRGQHLQIVISLTGQGLTTNYSIADWEEHQTNIGSPGMGGNYELKDWGNSNDIVIGGGGSGGDLPEDLKEIVGNNSPIWTGESTNNTFYTLNTYGLTKEHIVTNNIIVVCYKNKGDKASTVYFTTGHNNSDLSPRKTYSGTAETFLALKLTSDLVEEINSENGLVLGSVENLIIITKLYVITP